jgi:TonB C terminal
MVNTANLVNRGLVGTRPAQSRRLTIPFMGALASVLLHAILLTPVLLGATAHKTPSPRRQDTMSTVVRSSEESALTVIFIEESAPGAKSRATTAEVAPHLFAESAILAPVAAPELGPPPALVQSDGSEDEQRPANTAGESDPGSALMLGRYVGQITARVQRAWIRPRTPITSELFVCRVRVVQDRGGNVMEIELARCNGDIRWQASLVAAIQSASPLPAPPDPDVFSRTLTIEFTTEPYASGKDAEGFEPELRTVMN